MQSKVWLSAIVQMLVPSDLLNSLALRGMNRIYHHINIIKGVNECSNNKIWDFAESFCNEYTIFLRNVPCTKYKGVLIIHRKIQLIELLRGTHNVYKV